MNERIFGTIPPPSGPGELIDEWRKDLISDEPIVIEAGNLPIFGAEMDIMVPGTAKSPEGSNKPNTTVNVETNESSSVPKVPEAVQQPNKLAGLHYVPKDLINFVSIKSLLEVNGAYYVEHQGIITDAKTDKEAYERDYTIDVIDDDKLIYYLGDEALQDDSGRRTFQATKIAIREAKAQLERDEQVLKDAGDSLEKQLDKLKVEAGVTVKALFNEFGNFKVVEDLLNDPEYEHPAASILNSAYQGALAVCLESELKNEADAPVSIIDKFIESHKALIVQAREADRQSYIDRKFDPDEFYVEKDDAQMRLHKDVVGHYLTYLINETFNKFAKSEYTALVEESLRPAEGKPMGTIGKLRQLIMNASVVEEEPTLPTPKQKLDEELAALKLEGVRNEQAQTRAEQQLRTLLKNKSDLLGGEQKAVPIDIENPEHNPLLWVTDPLDAYDNLMGFMEVDDEYRDFVTASDRKTIKASLLLGYSTSEIDDDIDRLGKLMGDTKGTISRKYIRQGNANSNQLVPFKEGEVVSIDNYVPSKSYTVAHIGLVRRNQGDKPLNGAFLVEQWPYAFRPVLEGGEEPDRAMRLHVFHLTDAMAALVSSDYISFYAPGGRMAHGNLDRKLFNNIYEYTHREVAQAVDTFQNQLDNNRAKSAAAYVIPQFEVQPVPLSGALANGSGNNEHEAAEIDPRKRAALEATSR
jgi:hypothetical protein